jgi:hypothetical protein
MHNYRTSIVSDLSSNEIAFQNLIHEINDDLVVHKKVFRMTQLLEKYKAYLPADTGTYSSVKLQDRLVKDYAGSIVIHTPDHPCLPIRTLKEI